MNLKLRFSLLFTFFVAIILLISSTTIYFLYSNYRKEDYARRLKQEAIGFNSAYKNVAQFKFSLNRNKEINYSHQNSIIAKQILLLSSDVQIIYKKSDSLPIQYQPSFYSKVAQRKELMFSQGVREGIAIYNTESRQYLIVSGFDKFGLAKLANLQIILIAVFVGGLIFTGLLSFFFVQKAFNPLIHLSQQIQETTEYNLSLRVDEANGNDEIQQIARSFNAMLKRLNNAFESQKSFVQHASHELRTPLATMLSQTENALNKKLTIDEHKAVLESLKEDQIELIALTNSLLLLSQYEKTEFNNAWPSYRIDELLYDAVANSHKLFKDIITSIDFINIPLEENQLFIRGNETLLKSAFINLIKNAYNYSVDKTVNISIEILTENMLALHFINAGVQIQQDDIEKIMQPFYRGTNINNSKGFGLGLSIVQRIVQVHKGNFQYHPLGTHSNKFTIFLRSSVS